MIDEIRNAFFGKTVFVTGHTGFKGSWMSLWLNKLGAKVVGYSLGPVTVPSHYEVSRVHNAMNRCVFGDIRDADKIRHEMHQAQPDFVFHLAAQTVVKTGYVSPRETFDVNVTGTASVLDAVALLERPCVVVAVTSDKCYANDDRSRVFDENDAMGERDPYGASKGCTELVVKAYSHSFFNPGRYEEHGVAIASARAGNVVGGGDWTPYALLPDLVEAASLGGTVALRNPHATRPWQHVLQTLSGYLLLGARLGSDAKRYCGGWNFGPDENDLLSVSQFSEIFFKSWGQGDWFDASSAAQLHEAHSLRLSIAKARAQLGWRPVWDTPKTIEKCVTWFKQSQKGYSPMAIGLQQIFEFEADVEQIVAG